MFFSPVVVLNPNGQFLDCASIALSERHDCVVLTVLLCTVVTLGVGLSY